MQDKRLMTSTNIAQYNHLTLRWGATGRQTFKQVVASRLPPFEEAHAFSYIGTQLWHTPLAQTSGYHWL